jgi:hypothetical protein
MLDQVNATSPHRDQSQPLTPGWGDSFAALERPAVGVRGIRISY